MVIRVPELDLNADIIEAKDILNPLVTRLQGLLQMWHMFQSAMVVAQEFHSKYDDLTYQLKIACTRSFVVDYLKPWSGNYSPQINSLKQNLPGNKWHYTFLCPIITSNEHEELIELRNNIIAHLDQDYEGGGITLKGSLIRNVPTNVNKDEGTLDQVFLPAIPVLTGNRGLWWLSNKDKISEFVEHIKRTINLVEVEIRDTATIFRELCIDHMHVINQMPNLFGIIDMPIVAGNVDVTSHAEDPKPLTSSTPVQLKVGDQNIQSLVTVYEPRPEYPTNIEIDGKGYRLTIGEFSTDGKLNFTVSFPKYPWPKEPVK